MTGEELEGPGEQGGQVPPIPETRPNIGTKKPFISAILVVVIVLLLFGAVYAGMKIQEKGTTPTPSAKITPSQSIPTAIPTIDPTAEWKTYTNDKMKFSIKYPPGWFTHKETLYPIAEGRTSERYEAVFSFPVDNSSPQDFIDGQKAAINITYTPKPEWSFASYIDKLMSQDWGATPYQSETYVANIKATVIDIGKPPKNKYIIFDKSGWYFISLVVEKNETYETYSQLFNQILSTFKFTQ